MALNPDYKGPTSGRITIGAEGIVKRQTFTAETDPPLDKDGLKAVKWFTDLGPNAQLHEVRRLKWNLEEAQRSRDAWHRSARESDAKVLRLEAKLATFTPDGYRLPLAAEKLLAHAKAHGWMTGRAWTTYDEPFDGAKPYASLRVELGNGDHLFQLRWACEPDGSGRLAGSGLARSDGKPWHDAPSLVKIKGIITDNPVIKP